MSARIRSTVVPGLVALGLVAFAAVSTACPVGEIPGPDGCLALTAEEGELLSGCEEAPDLCAVEADLLDTPGGSAADLALSVALAQTACQHGSARGCLHYGRMAAAGRGRPGDANAARAAFAQACQQGETSACGYLVASGSSEDTHAVECAQGRDAACRALIADGREPDDTWFDAQAILCGRGDASACRLLGQAHLERASYADAHAVFATSCRLGNRRACLMKRALGDSGRLSEARRSSWDELVLFHHHHSLRGWVRMEFFVDFIDLQTRALGEVQYFSPFSFRVGLAPIEIEVGIMSAVSGDESLASKGRVSVGVAPLNLGTPARSELLTRSGFGWFEPFVHYRVFMGGNPYPSMAVGNRFTFALLGAEGHARLGVEPTYLHGFGDLEHGWTVAAFIGGGLGGVLF